MFWLFSSPAFICVTRYILSQIQLQHRRLSTANGRRSPGPDIKWLLDNVGCFPEGYSEASGFQDSSHQWLKTQASVVKHSTYSFTHNHPWLLIFRFFLILSPVGYISLLALSLSTCLPSHRICFFFSHIKSHSSPRITLNLIFCGSNQG